MSDIDHDRLYEVAESQSGYFTAAQAISAGMDRSTLSHHARLGGRFERVRRGLYRLRHFPTSSREHVVAAWLPLRSAGAVVSHASALELYGLSDIIPDAVHVTVPRRNRGVRARDGIRIHTVDREILPSTVRYIDGLPVTDPEQTILDAFDDGAQPEQIELAVQQALHRALTTPARIREEASARSARVQDFINQTIEESTR